MECIVQGKTSKRALRKILNCVVAEIRKNVEKRESNVFNYLDYEEKSDELHEEILRKIVPYDESLGFVTNITNTLKSIFKATNNKAAVIPKVIAVDVERLVEPDSLTDNQEAEDTTKTQFVDLSTPVKLPIEHTPIIRTEAAMQETHDDSLVLMNSSDSENSVFSESPVFNRQRTEVGSLIPSNSNSLIECQRNEALLSMYSERVKKISIELDMRENHLRTPTTSFLFRAEWKKFYNRLSFKISSLGQFNYYDVFWHEHIRQLKQNELSEKSKLLQTRLNIASSPARCVKQKFIQINGNATDDYEEFLPKRQKLSSESQIAVIAYELAFEHFQAGKRLSPEELIPMIEQRKVENERRQHCLTDVDLLNFHRNFKYLSFKEQTNFLSYMNNLKITEPLRHKYLNETFKAQDLAQ